ncbi:MAG TPA: iron-containing alcohol dehydrogenase [Pyrinomonadaceae bacterium]|nr:iron-containing alcohol dehydrogenase [Pyrinomonadaceae bacterium]
MNQFEFKLTTQLVSGAGAFDQLGTRARELGFRRALIVTDHDLFGVGYLERANSLLNKLNIETFSFHDFGADPDSDAIERGSSFAADLQVDSIIGLGGGSSLDCAKGINFLLTNGGRIQDYVGYGKVTRPMLPMIGIPTTSGTGSEVQSYAVISDAKSHLKMACGDKQAAFRLAILDPQLTLSQPQPVTAASGFDALAHAVETYVSTSRTPFSELFSGEAWRLLESNYETLFRDPKNLKARAAMQLGACYAGIAIENSMLGATHACANLLTARYGTVHGVALAMLLPTVVRWNANVVADRYASLLELASRRPEAKQGGVEGYQAVEALAHRLEQLATAGGLKTNLSSSGIQHADLRSLADEAATQWTGRFNPRPFDGSGAFEIYQAAW